MVGDSYAPHSAVPIRFSSKFSSVFFSGVPLMKCCRIDDALPENTIIGLSPSCVANYTSAPIPLSQAARGYPRGLLQSFGGHSDALTLW